MVDYSWHDCHNNGQDLLRQLLCLANQPFQTFAVEHQIVMRLPVTYQVVGAVIVQPSLKVATVIVQPWREGVKAS